MRFRYIYQRITEIQTMMSPASTSHSSPSNVDQLTFLRRIAHDDQLRAELESNPRAALSRIGVHCEPGDDPERVELPSKLAVQRFLCDLGEDDRMEKPPWFGFI